MNYDDDEGNRHACGKDEIGPQGHQIRSQSIITLTLFSL
jgi:hypothetical protein